MSSPIRSQYAAAGVDTASQARAMGPLGRLVSATFSFRKGLGEVKLPLGLFANVLAVDDKLGIAFCTDGVGTKLLVAQMAGRYDTVGIDCVAMNANDLLCVGAEPLALVDYMAVQRIDSEILEEIGRGLYEGARQANVTIPGGEIAQVPDMLRGIDSSYAFDLAGTCIGVVPLDRVVVGQDLRPGDVVLGFESSGLHSNGYSLARRVLLQEHHIGLHDRLDEVGRPLAEELLEPTRIYVREVVEMFQSGLPLKALSHITSDGLLNLLRVQARVGFEITWLPEPKPIFRLIQDLGHVSDEEMYYVFNMGIGFCLIVPDDEAQIARATEIAAKHGTACWRIGRVTADEQKRVVLAPKGLVGAGDRFVRA